MKRVVDVVVVFILIVSVVSIFLFKGTSDAATGKVVVQETQKLAKEDIVFPNAEYNFRFCVQSTDGVQVGLVNKKSGDQLIERFTLSNDQTNTYSCGKAWVVKTTQQ
jgi:hypothetical protein